MIKIELPSFPSNIIWVLAGSMREVIDLVYSIPQIIGVDEFKTIDNESAVVFNLKEVKIIVVDRFDDGVEFILPSQEKAIWFKSVLDEILDKAA